MRSKWLTGLIGFASRFREVGELRGVEGQAQYW